MDKKLFLVILLIINSAAGVSVWTLIHDVVQNNVAGTPVIHEKTEWDFQPDIGKRRRIQFEALNGHQGRDLIDRLGMGIGYKGPWGTPIGRNFNAPKP